MPSTAQNPATPPAAARPTPSLPGLEVEWQRLECLGECLLAARQGRPVEEALALRLEALQEAVVATRFQTAAWQVLPVAGLEMGEMDVLACVLAPEAQPRLAWLYQSLQPGEAGAYPTLALVQALLALDGESLARLRHALRPSGPLRQRHLIECAGSGPFQVLSPGNGVASRLLGFSDLEAPPGAIRVETQARWDDLILTPSRKDMIHEFLLWIRHRPTVVGEWRGADVGGPIALFAGPSGTGKTFAALAIAHALGWPLFRVDLGRLVSKYIGETEKNLNRLFDAAHNQPMVLQFDEVDSIMGKRGEIREARDRYANMEVSHLLARIEQHRGPCILTTNLRGHLDTAFYRRFQIVVEFPMPDREARARLWAKLLPPAAPREPAVTPAFLAGTEGLTGGNIRNAALHAAYLAAEADSPIGLSHLAHAVWRELTKSGRAAVPGDLGPLEPHLPTALLEGVAPPARRRG
jgi:hypothetical protein